MQSPPANNPAGHRGYSRVWPWDFLPSRLRNTCWSSRRAAPQSRHETNPPTFAATTRTVPACAPRSDPDSGRAGLSPPPQNLLPAIRPSRCPETIADVTATRCPDRSTDSPPATATPSPNSPLLVRPAVVVARNHPGSTDATARTPASSCRTREPAAAPVRSVSPAVRPPHRGEFPGLRETDSECTRSADLRRTPLSSCARPAPVGR